MFSKNHVNGLGYKMHDQMADAFFKRAVEVIGASEDKGAARAYIYGFICHFALDSECHKYIEKMIQVSGISHSEIEMELDRVFLTDDFINPVTYLGTKHIHPTLENAQVIAPFFEGITAEEVKQSLSSMVWVAQLFLRSSGYSFKRKIVFQRHEDRGHVRFHARTCDERVAESSMCRLLSAVKEAVCGRSSAGGKSDPTVSESIVSWRRIAETVP